MTASDETVLAALRAEIAGRGWDGFLIPRADRHLGEYVPEADARLAFATGFTGSAGLALVTQDAALLFVDGRYELQGEAEAGPRGYQMIPTAKTSAAAWMRENAVEGARIAADSRLHPQQQLAGFETALGVRGAALVAVEDNPVDAVWDGGRFGARPPRPKTPVVIQPVAAAGESAADKRARIGASLAKKRVDAAVVTAPESLCWLLNIRGGDVPFKPLALGYGIVRKDGSAALFSDPEKFSPEIVEHLGGSVTIAPWEAFGGALDALAGLRVLVDPARSPAFVATRLRAAGADVVAGDDPCLLPKARKNAAEIAGAQAAHARDGAAMAEALAWLDQAAPSGGLTELGVSDKLRAIRAETASRLGSELKSESFPAIVGFGPNGAVVHYRVTEETSLPIAGDGLLLIDSGGQYQDGTTDLTRVVAIGNPEPAARRSVTLVLKGMIALSRLRFPAGVEGRRIEAIARMGLWAEGLDFDHGVGHGVGSYLCVHEGPQGLSAGGAAALEEGMIVSIEPGLYVAGRFGVRVENLAVVSAAEPVAGGFGADAALGARPMRRFETLTLAPIDRRLIDLETLGAADRAWVDAYHERVLAEIGPLVRPETRPWLAAACAPL